MLELEIPSLSRKLEDLERNASFLQIELTYTDLEGVRADPIRAELSLSIYNEEEAIAPEINEAVQTNMLRVRGAEVINEARVVLERGNF